MAGGVARTTGSGRRVAGAVSGMRGATGVRYCAAPRANVASTRGWGALAGSGGADQNALLVGTEAAARAALGAPVSDAAASGAFGF
jgi:hypothetical protein